MLLFCSRLLNNVPILLVCLRRPSQPTSKQFSLAQEFLGKVVVQVEKKFLVLEHFSTPGCVINALQFLQLFLQKSSPDQSMSS